MKAVKTRYHDAFDARPARIVASAEPHGENIVTVEYDSRLSPDDNHRNAALTLCKKLKWGGLYSESHPYRDINVYVPARSKDWGFILDAGEAL